MKKEDKEKGKNLNSMIHITTLRTRIITLLLLVIFIVTFVVVSIVKVPVKHKVIGCAYPTDKSGMQVFCVISAGEYTREDVQRFSDEVSLKFYGKDEMKGKVVSISEIPMMEENMKDVFVNDWLREQCVKDDYNWLVTIDSDQDISDQGFSTVEVTFLKEKVSLFSYLLRK